MCKTRGFCLIPDKEVEHELVRQTSHPEKLWIVTLYSDLHDDLKVRNHDNAGIRRLSRKGQAAWM